MLGCDICPVPLSGPSRIHEARWAERICTPKEFNWWHEFPENERVYASTRLWCIKEAAYKAASQQGYPRVFRPKDFEVSHFAQPTQTQVDTPYGTYNACYLMCQSHRQQAGFALVASPVLWDRVQLGTSLFQGSQLPIRSGAIHSLSQALDAHFPQCQNRLQRTKKGFLAWENAQHQRQGWVSLSHQAQWVGWAFVPDPQTMLANSPALDEY